MYNAPNIVSTGTISEDKQQNVPFPREPMSQGEQEAHQKPLPQVWEGNTVNNGASISPVVALELNHISSSSHLGRSISVPYSSSPAKYHMWFWMS